MYKKYGEDLEVRDYFKKDEVIDTYSSDLNDNIPETVNAVALCILIQLLKKVMINGIK